MQFILQPRETFTLLSTLTKDQLPVFGKMSAQHMVEHLALILRLSNGRIQVPVNFPSEKVEAYRKKIINGPDPIPQGVQMEKGNDTLPELRQPDLTHAIADLIVQIEKFHAYFDNQPGTTSVHPFFGELNKEEWQIFHQKHFTHHLKQFNLIR